METQINAVDNKKLSLFVNTPKDTSDYPLVVCTLGWLSKMSDEIVTTLSKDLEEAGIASIRFDPRGAGASEGSFQTDFRVSNIDEDLKMILKYAKGLSNRIGLFGHSIGAFLSLKNSSENADVKSVVAVSPMRTVNDIKFSTPLDIWKQTGWFTKVTANGETIRMPYDFVTDMNQYNIFDCINKINIPKLFVLGLNDKRIDREVVMEIYAKANEPKELLELPIEHDYRNYPDQIKLVNKPVVEFFKKYL